MVKTINLEKDHFGSSDNVYIFEGCKIQVLPYFLYEITIGKYWEEGYSVLSSRQVKSGSVIPIKRSSEIKNFGDYSIEKTIILLGAPLGFIEELKLSHPNSKYNKQSKKERKKKRRK